MSTVLSVTRQPMYPGYDTLGGPDEPGETYEILVDGVVIGGSFWDKSAPRRKRWASYGPAGDSRGHRSRAAAEHAQAAASRARRADPFAVLVSRDWHDGPVQVRRTVDGVMVLCPCGHVIGGSYGPDYAGSAFEARIGEHTHAVRTRSTRGLWVVCCSGAIHHPGAIPTPSSGEAVPA